ncbi:tail fiber protein [Pokkaliibacter sp. MBI-7]|uniref:phage tail protein n=1 Tax=Pokkaliibacter sp. MBI-7 TaxID=3040600 RepID=UPI00244789E9|nr:tail fiber protein [Pokkaliibacter sp. MBI-7]MDH2435576.1 tail fiber protein [Pokkaliibacter sp. MBI-7]
MEPYLGEIRIFAGNYAPENWAFCNGQLLAIVDYQALYALIGTTYGGDGRSTFQLPNMNGSVPIGQGQGTGLTNRVMGQSGGSQTVTLTEAQIPAHTHDLYCSTLTATSATPAQDLFFADTADSIYLVYTNPQQGQTTQDVNYNAQAISATGSNAAHYNMMPYIGLNYIIALQGLYPTQP